MDQNQHQHEFNRRYKAIFWQYRLHQYLKLIHVKGCQLRSSLLGVVSAGSRQLWNSLGWISAASVNKVLCWRSIAGSWQRNLAVITNASRVNPDATVCPNSQLAGSYATVFHKFLLGYGVGSHDAASLHNLLLDSGASSQFAKLNPIPHRRRMLHLGMAIVLIGCLVTTGCQSSRQLITAEAIAQLQGATVRVISSDVQLRIANKMLENRLVDLINNQQTAITKNLVIMLSYSSYTTDIRGGRVTDRYRFTLTAHYRLLGLNGEVITAGQVSSSGNYETDLHYYRDSQAKYEAIKDSIHIMAQMLYYRLLDFYHTANIATPTS